MVAACSSQGAPVPWAGEDIAALAGTPGLAEVLARAGAWAEHFRFWEGEAAALLQTKVQARYMNREVLQLLHPIAVTSPHAQLWRNIIKTKIEEF